MAPTLNIIKTSFCASNLLSFIYEKHLNIYLYVYYAAKMIYLVV